jgi:hypothetical protein
MVDAGAVAASAADGLAVAGFVEGTDREVVQSQPPRKSSERMVGLDNVGARIRQGADGGRSPRKGALSRRGRQPRVDPRGREGRRERRH